MPLFEIPYWQRSVNVTKNATCFYRRVEILHVDEVGIFLLYDEESQKDVNFIRRHLVMRSRGKCYIEASSLRRAIKRFYIKYEGARVGGKQREAKALWINNEKYILELPYCRLMHRNKKGEFICGRMSKEDDGDQGEWGMCVLEGYEAPENCIIALFKDRLREFERELPAIAKNVDGFKFIEPRMVLP